MGLRDFGARLPPGFRFYPNDEELVCDYLHKKIENEKAGKATLVEIDLHVCEPWQLPQEAKLNNREWYFFSFRDRKYATGFRTNRATTSGYWKATGKDRVILDPETKVIVGMRKTLVFYQNRAPNGIKTGWIMHEFRLESPHMPPKEDWVLCRVFHKSKQGDNNNNNKCQQMFDYNTLSDSSPPPPLISSPTLSNTNALSECQQSNSFPSNYPSFSLKPMFCPNNNDPNYNGVNINSNHHIVNSSYSFSDLINSSADNDDAYGFLWDIDIEENSKLGGEEGAQHDEFGDNEGF